MQVSQKGVCIITMRCYIIRYLTVHILGFGELHDVCGSCLINHSIDGRKSRIEKAVKTTSSFTGFGCRRRLIISLGRLNANFIIMFLDRMKNPFLGCGVVVSLTYFRKILGKLF